MKLSNLQNELSISGEFKAIARNKTRVIEINSPPLLGRNTHFELGMQGVRPEDSLKELY